MRPERAEAKNSRRDFPAHRCAGKRPKCARKACRARLSPHRSGGASGGVFEPADRPPELRQRGGAGALRGHARGPRHALRVSPAKRRVARERVCAGAGAGRALRGAPSRGRHGGDRRDEDSGQREQTRGRELCASRRDDAPARSGSGDLLAKAEQADATLLQDGRSVPAEVARRQERKAKLAQARAAMQARAPAQLGPPPRVPPAPKEQINFTDPDSAIMKAGSGQHFEQSYHGQAALEVQSRLFVAARLTTRSNCRPPSRPLPRTHR